jgi:hypothetical protein
LLAKAIPWLLSSAWAVSICLAEKLLTPTVPISCASASRAIACTWLRIDEKLSR